MRVLMVMGALTEYSGGGERAVVGLATSLPPDRYDVTVCMVRPSRGAPVRALEQAGVRVVDLQRTKRIDPGAVGRLLRMMRRDRFDVIHGHMFGANLWTVIVGRLLRVPVVIAHEQTWAYEGQPLRRLLDMVIGRLADTFIAVSARDAARMASLEKVPEDKIMVLPNAWAPRPGTRLGDLRAELSIPREAPVVASVAVFRPQKRLELLIEAFGRLRERMPEAVLVIAGDGERAPLEALVAELGITQAVHFLGLREDVETIWRGSDVAAMSSDFEGTPLAALEAMSFGVPLVSTDVGGLPDIAGAGEENGVVLVPPREPAALAAALEGVLRDRDRLARLGQAAQQRAAEFTAERHAGRCAALYDDLLANSRRR